MQDLFDEESIAGSKKFQASNRSNKVTWIKEWSSKSTVKSASWIDHGEEFNRDRKSRHLEEVVGMQISQRDWNYLCGTRDKVRMLCGLENEIEACVQGVRYG